LRLEVPAILPDAVRVFANLAGIIKETTDLP